MNYTRILDTEKLDELFLASTWVWAGLEPTQENLDTIVEELELTEANTVYVCYGSMINAHYGFTDNNAYPNDFPFIFIYDYYDVLKRIEYNANWFDILVQNGLINQAFMEQESENEIEYEEE